MLNVYRSRNSCLAAADCAGGVPRDVVWIDLAFPTGEEEAQVEAMLGIDVPTREDMQEIESSSRLYQDRDALFLTATVLLGSDTASPETAPVTFILLQDRLVTVRYGEPRAFAMALAQLQRPNGAVQLKPEAVLAQLLEAMIDRAADIIERIAHEVDDLSRDIFEEGARKPSRAKDLQTIMRAIGRQGDLLSKVRESIASIGRLLAFLGGADRRFVSQEVQGRVGTMDHDTQSIADHAAFLGSKTTFLLDATLGLVNIEQNAIIKIFSVVAVIFLPPTLVASIYGMNFRYMPELDWLLGYPFALALMLASAVLPFLYFKRKGWL
ncbi:MAG TPA: magnesium/cobalt transporter CorA [Afifellaceae bacterium]|nr:magnesium/cobalt transporter CorA [Afifellaceae bacterium]